MPSPTMIAVLLFTFCGLVFGDSQNISDSLLSEKFEMFERFKKFEDMRKVLSALHPMTVNGTEPRNANSTTERDTVNVTMPQFQTMDPRFYLPDIRRVNYGIRTRYNSPRRRFNAYQRKPYRSYFFRGRLTTTSLPIVLNVDKCPDRYGWVAKNDYCYFFSSEQVLGVEKKSWHDARKYCVQQGGDLLSIEDSAESTFIMQYIGKFKDTLLWIGGRAEFVGSFKWSDGKPFLFTYWNNKEPNNVMGQEDCLSLYPDNGKWNDDNCGRNLNFVCKKPKNGNYSSNDMANSTISDETSEVSGNCPEGFSKAGNKCYLLRLQKQSYEIARNFCRTFPGGELASINSQFEQDFISSMFWGMETDIDYVWIGMKYLNGFLWLDQSTVDFTNWNKGEPNNNGNDRSPHIWRQRPLYGIDFNDHSEESERPDSEECVEIIVKESYMWNDKSCKRENRFICQTPVDDTLEYDQKLTFCDSPYNNFVKKGEGCYKVINEEKSWKEAEDFCQQLGSNLMSIEFLEENNYIYTTLLKNYTEDDRFWMGMNFNNKSQSFKFSDENPVLFTNWGMDANDSCIVISIAGNGKWYSEPCSRTHKFICKYSKVKYILEGPDVTGSCPSEQWIDLHGEYCYLLETEEKTDWINANLRCLREGGDLASIHSEQEGNLLRNLFVRNHIQHTTWIGLVRSGNSFSWSDGTPMNHQNWASGEPNDIEELCGELTHLTQLWNDNNCARLNNYLCKIPKIIFTDTIPITEEFITTAIPKDESSSETIFSAMNNPELSVQSEYRLRNPTMTIIVCLLSISLLVSVSVMAYYYKRKYKMARMTLGTSAMDDSVHYNGGYEQDQIILT